MDITPQQIANAAARIATEIAGRSSMSYGATIDLVYHSLGQARTVPEVVVGSAQDKLLKLGARFAELAEDVLDHAKEEAEGVAQHLRTFSEELYSARTGIPTPPNTAREDAMSAVTEAYRRHATEAEGKLARATTWITRARATLHHGLLAGAHAVECSANGNTAGVCDCWLAEAIELVAEAGG